MHSLLFQIVSAFVATLVFIVWLRPQTFEALLDKDRSVPSLGRQGQFTAMIVSTWVLVVLTIRDDVSEWFFSMYMFAWAGSQFGSLWLKMKGQTTSTPDTDDVVPKPVVKGK